MASSLEISSLQRFAVKPAAWRMLEHLDGTYTLEFTHIPLKQGGGGEWAGVQTRRGELKHYKTANAALGDVKKVQADAVLIVSFSDTI